jgi:hypothetical protein
MQNLTEVLPHPVTTTFAPTAGAFAAKAIGCLTLLQLKAGVT